MTFLNDSVFELKDCSLNLIRNHSKGDKVSIYVHQNLKDKVKDDLKDYELLASEILQKF